MHPFVEQLRIIEERILGWPDNVALWAGDTVDKDAAFEILEDQLRALLDTINQLPLDERDAVKNEIEIFQSNITIHHQKTEKRLREIQGTYENSLQYLKASKAYTQF